MFIHYKIKARQLLFCLFLKSEIVQQMYRVLIELGLPVDEDSLKHKIPSKGDEQRDDKAGSRKISVRTEPDFCKEVPPVEKMVKQLSPKRIK